MPSTKEKTLNSGPCKCSSTRDRLSRLAERSVNHLLTQGRNCPLRGLRYHNSLPRGEAVGLNHDRRGQRFDVLSGRVEVAEHLRASGWDAGTGHQVLREALAGLDSRG